jgi:undecaprenyl-diphosphatase
VATNPKRAIALIAGSGGVTACYALGLVASVNAFGGGVGAGKVIAVYLGGAALAAVAPTPGGMGPLEAALVAGLIGVGLATGPAVAAVLVYRLISYWAPVLPGFILYRSLRARSII